MNHIQPIKKPINMSDITEWQNEYLDIKTRLDDFVDNMAQQNISEEKALEMWLHNFEAIPPSEPERLYHCIITVPDVKIVLTVLKRDNILAGQRRYDVVKLNSLYIDTYDYTRRMTIDENKNIVFKIEHKDLSRNESISKASIEDLEVADNEFATIEHYSNKTSYPLNYEDSNWFTSMHISDLLNKVKVRIKPYTVPEDGENIKLPKLFIQNLDFMKASDFEFTDEEFKEKLFDKINEKFIEIESDLK